jgi:integrase
MLIPEPNFYLKNVNATEPKLIYLQAKYSHQGSQRLMISTGDKILPSRWDSIKKRAITSKKYPENDDINLWLDKMATAFKTVVRSCLIDEISPKADVVKQKMEELLQINQTSTSDKKITFYSFVEKYIDDNRSLKSANTIKAYQTTFLRIKEFGKFCNKEFNFDDITLEWRSEFITYLQRSGISKNTEGKHIKIVKVFMNEATERGINSSLAFKSKSFSKPVEDVHKIFLTSEEILKIAALDLHGDKTNEIVRDYFVISCYTSLRYSDFTRIRLENIVDNKIKMRTVKTGQEVIIPISPVVKSILEKYNYCLPKAPCNQLFNRCLKAIGKLAEIDEPVTITKTIAGVKNSIIYKKWQLLTTHTGRRSLISNCILGGINTSSIMMISGHKSLKVFQGYVRINQQQNADALSQHSFFNS